MASSMGLPAAVCYSPQLITGPGQSMLVKLTGTSPNAALACPTGQPIFLLFYDRPPPERSLSLSAGSLTNQVFAGAKVSKMLVKQTADVVSLCAH